MTTSGLHKGCSVTRYTQICPGHALTYIIFRSKQVTYTNQNLNRKVLLINTRPGVCYRTTLNPTPVNLTYLSLYCRAFLKRFSDQLHLLTTSSWCPQSTFLVSKSLLIPVCMQDLFLRRKGISRLSHLTPDQWYPRPSPGKLEGDDNVSSPGLEWGASMGYPSTHTWEHVCKPFLASNC